MLCQDSKTQTSPRARARTRTEGILLRPEESEIVATASQTSSLPDPALHLGLVRLQVKRFKACYRWIPADDFYSAGLVGLCEAARRYDPARGTTFATYAMHWIKG
jgi:RNA polymerase sigma-32 factor